MVSHRIGKVDDTVSLKNGIVTVSDKSGLVEFVSELFGLAPGLSLFSTGGTYRTLSQGLEAGDTQRGNAASAGGSAGQDGEPSGPAPGVYSGHSGDSTGRAPGGPAPTGPAPTGPAPDDSGLYEISSYTGQPETEGGLVKTLDFRIYLGLLTEAHNESHIEDRRRTESRLFDLVVVNLYPFGEAVSQADSDLEKARGNIDIGGPTLLRAAAKNFPRVAVVCDPGDYPALLEEVRRGNGALSLNTRFELARKAFAHVAEYDRAIDEYLGARAPEELSALSRWRKGDRP